MLVFYLYILFNVYNEVFEMNARMQKVILISISLVSGLYTLLIQLQPSHSSTGAGSPAGALANALDSIERAVINRMPVLATIVRDIRT